MRRLFPLLASLFIVSGCNKPGDFFFIKPQLKKVSDNLQVKETVAGGKLDILWVIDNSGSMGSHQQDVITNMDVFIQSLTSSASSAIDWKSGLISTSIEDSPYAGFVPGTELLSSDPNVAQKFKDAVAQLGTDGDGTEQTFDPVVQVLNAYPTFRRPGATFAIILISDAPEQSYNYNESTFVQYLKAQGGGTLANTYFYGFLNPEDWCIPTDDPWMWNGSPFQALNQAVQGQVYKLCDPNFAQNLQNLGQNLSTSVDVPRVYLTAVPKPETIHVFYQGTEIKGGTQAQGGSWLYRSDINAIEFSNLSWATGANASVNVTYDQDNGVE